jgi:hypothetical protein
LGRYGIKVYHFSLSFSLWMSYETANELAVLNIWGKLQFGGDGLTTNGLFYFLYLIKICDICRRKYVLLKRIYCHHYILTGANVRWTINCHQHNLNLTFIVGNFHSKGFELHCSVWETNVYVYNNLRIQPSFLFSFVYIHA